MQPLIYKQRVQRWGFRKSMLASLIFHGVVIFGVSFVVFQQPWDYNKEAIVNIKLVEKMPTSSWMRSSPREYGFYSNVNPNVDHPRWSQASERVIGSGILSERIPTQMFNGYGDEVANLYSGMDLKKYF